MDTRIYDWKDVANSQFEKAFTMAVLVLLFGVMVIPKIDIQQQKFIADTIKIVDLDPEERREIKTLDIKPVINILIDEEIALENAKETDLQDLYTQLDVDIHSTKVKTEDRLIVFVPYDTAPEPINRIAPEYPIHAIRTGIEGKVILEVDVYRDGSLGEIIVKTSLQRGPGGLDEAAVETVKKWRFRPGLSGDKPVDTRVIIPIEFKLTD